MEVSLLGKRGVTLVLGSSGTGKTKMIISTIVCTVKMGLRILVCTGSNTAVDIIAD